MQQESKLLLPQLKQPPAGSALRFKLSNLPLQLSNHLLRLRPRRLRGDQLPNRLALFLMLPLNLTLLKLPLQLLDLTFRHHNLPLRLNLHLVEALFLPNVSFHYRLALQKRDLEGG